MIQVCQLPDGIGHLSGFTHSLAILFTTVPLGQWHPYGIQLPWQDISSLMLSHVRVQLSGRAQPDVLIWPVIGHSVGCVEY